VVLPVSQRDALASPIRKLTAQLQLPATVEDAINMSKMWNMRYLLLIACIAATVIFAGCATGMPPKIAYRDDRVLATQPAARSEKPADVLVRVQEYQSPAVPADSMKAMPTTVPVGAKLIASGESLASYGAPFYCTVGLPERRIEWNGLMKPDVENKVILLQFGFADRVPGGVRSINTTQMIELGTTHIIMACTDGAFVTVALERIAR
jgi:hypothetical protein